MANDETSKLVKRITDFLDSDELEQRDKKTKAAIAMDALALTNEHEYLAGHDWAADKVARWNTSAKAFIERYNVP